MDPGYNKENRGLIESNTKALGIPVSIFESDIFDAVDTIDKSPCYICARMRRGYLYSKAKELGDYPYGHVTWRTDPDHDAKASQYQF